MIRIFADFNNLSPCRIPLNSEGSLADIRMQNEQLREGMRVLVYDDMCEAEAVVEWFHGGWYGRVVLATFRNDRLHEEWIHANAEFARSLENNKKQPR